MYQFRHSLDPLRNVFLPTDFTSNRSEIIWRHVKSSPRLHRCTTGWCTVWETFSVRWVTELRFTRLRRLRVRNGDLEIKEYVVLQKPQEQAYRLPPPRTLILDFTLTHTRYDSSHVHTTGHLTNTRRSDDTPELDGVLREVVRKKILHYRQLYINRPDPISFLPVVVDTTGRLYDDFSRLLFLHAHREGSALSNEIPEESGQFILQINTHS